MKRDKAARVGWGALWGTLGVSLATLYLTARPLLLLEEATTAPQTAFDRMVAVLGQAGDAVQYPRFDYTRSISRAGHLGPVERGEVHYFIPGWEGVLRTLHDVDFVRSPQVLPYVNWEYTPLPRGFAAAIQAVCARRPPMCA